MSEHKYIVAYGNDELVGVYSKVLSDMSEASLDKVAYAIAECNWDELKASRRYIVHIFEITPEGDVV